MSTLRLRLISIQVNSSIYLTEMVLNIVLQYLLYLNTSHVQYSLYTVLLRVQFMYSAADSTVYVQCC